MLHKKSDKALLLDNIVSLSFLAIDLEWLEFLLVHKQGHLGILRTLSQTSFLVRPSGGIHRMVSISLTDSLTYPIGINIVSERYVPRFDFTKESYLTSWFILPEKYYNGKPFQVTKEDYYQS